MEMLVSIIVIIGAGTLIVKQYQSHAVLLLAGMLLIVIALMLNNGKADFLPASVQSTGFIGFDIVELISSLMSDRTAKLGLIIMSAGGFSKYLGHIGAADTLVMLAVKPLSKISNPYVVLGLAYVVGQLLNIFIPSAAGLAMLLLVAMYPVLVKLGVTPAAAAAVIGTTACLDLGPASGAANMAARTAQMDVAEYFASYQILAALFVIPVVAVLHGFTQAYFDRQDRAAGKGVGSIGIEQEVNPAPTPYALLPLAPLTLLLVFSSLNPWNDGVRLDVVTAMMISLFLGIMFEIIRYRSIKQPLKDIMVFFQGMGQMFTTVVTLIVAAGVFATGLKTIGFINGLTSGAEALGMVGFAMTMVLVLIISTTAFITGSGNAAFYSFAELAPPLAIKFGISSVAMLLPMQLAAGLARSFSPVAGVIIAVAGAANVSPFDVVKRTLVPMLGGMIVMLVYSALML